MFASTYFGNGYFADTYFPNGSDTEPDAPEALKSTTGIGVGLGIGLCLVFGLLVIIP